jgi:FlaA1/EpsC-like NDP-sugar epimerase
VSLYALIWGIAGFMTALDGVIPRSVIIINWILSLMAIGGLRIIARLIISGDIHILSKKINSEQKQVLVYGAGDAGIQLVSGLEYSSEYNPVGFIDDASELKNKQIRGLNIYSVNEIDALIDRFNLDEILIAIPSLSRSDRNTMLEKLEPYPVEVRLLPGVSELADGKVNIDDLREVDINDLLGRDIIQANKELLVQNITKKTVVVTGAGGSIGSELCRQVISLKPSALIMYEINELALYTIEKELLAKCSVAIYPILGSVNNSSRLTKIFKRFNVDTVYHTAAYKHVPMVEFNNTEGVNNNIFGTLSCAQSAIKSSVKTFVLISTDKAVRPTNTMGATKRCAELILQALADRQSVTTFSMVRFGNVLGSSGSVIPLFKQQIRNGGPVTVTNKDIIRYFMTIPEAVELVIQAGAMSTGGDVFVLDMGEPVRIDDLARKMIRLTGLEVKDNLNHNGDIEIEYTGLRPGEKLFEELLIGDNVSKTGSPLIMKVQEEMLSWSELELILDNLRLAVDDDMHVKLRKLLIKAVPGFKPQCGIEDILYKN